MFQSFSLNRKLLGHPFGSENFPWQLGLVSTEGSWGSQFNHAAGKQAALECGLMLSPGWPKLSCLTVFLGRQKVRQGSANISKMLSRIWGIRISLSQVRQTQSPQRSSKGFFLNLDCFIWQLLLIWRTSQDAISLIVHSFYRFLGNIPNV